MTRVDTDSIGKFHHHYPRVAAIVTAQAGGRDNAMAVAWHTAISLSPPLYGVSISPKRFTCQLIIESREFSINFMPFKTAELVAAVGGSKGAEIDKFQRFSIARDMPLKVGAPILKEAYAAYECTLVERKTYGDHEWLVGEIVATHFTEEAFTAEQVLDLSKIEPTLYLGAELYLSSAKDTLRLLDRQVYGKRER